MTKPRNDDHALVSANRLNSLVDVFRRDALMDAAVAQAACRAAELPPDELAKLWQLSPDELKERGWTRPELNVATHALESAKDVPFFLRMAHDRYIARLRILPTDEGPTKESAHAIVIPTSATPMPEAEPDEDEDEQP